VGVVEADDLEPAGPGGALFAQEGLRGDAKPGRGPVGRLVDRRAGLDDPPSAAGVAPEQEAAAFVRPGLLGMAPICRSPLEPIRAAA